MIIDNIKKSFVALFTLVATFLSMTAVALADLMDDAKGGVGEVDTGLPSSGVSGILQNITSALLFLIGAVSVIMIIIGGIRFIFSQGDPQAAASARQTVIYSVVGVIVAVLAWAIVNYVLIKLYAK